MTDTYVPIGQRLMDEAATIFEVRKGLRGGGQEAVRARWACALVLRRMDWSYPRIGHRLRLDHSAIIHGVKKAEKLFNEDPYFRHAIVRLQMVAQEYMAG